MQTPQLCTFKERSIECEAWALAKYLALVLPAESTICRCVVNTLRVPLVDDKGIVVEILTLACR